VFFFSPSRACVLQHRGGKPRGGTPRPLARALSCRSSWNTFEIAVFVNLLPAAGYLGFLIATTTPSGRPGLHFVLLRLDLRPGSHLCLMVLRARQRRLSNRLPARSGVSPIRCRLLHNLTGVLNRNGFHVLLP